MPAFQTSDGRALSYSLAGSGPPLVCHPGGPGFSSLYFGDLPGLASDRMLVLLNPRGTSDSARPASPSGYRIEDYAADIDELRAHLELEWIDLLGHSHGGCVAMQYAGHVPPRGTPRAGKHTRAVRRRATRGDGGGNADKGG